ncbi:thioredoxin domain-containing protein [Pelagicoccus albus]|uniref:Thioredoxin domain-containing protein n=1 Tax=Pelagicoccus albus TaxID=415222 RepID=A0A7X1B6R0_9BACT|nr:thioredoxin domain-containing protein [Pelagicoccus albus]MBC2606557.1 thioredoxin domain-containing protein [Pelagicoccus albus]
MPDPNKISLNDLARSRSPYLLQHADNPVQWREWGEAAFAEARRRDVPIFLSVGYSTCHWCHVMAHESFEDAEIAQTLNELFVNVKVDREERPDVDRIYMSYVQATAGQGGWPMSVWLTPDLKPFYGGTYFPPTDNYGRVGFTTLIDRIGTLWSEDKATLLGYGEKSRELLQENAGHHQLEGIAEAGDAIEMCLEELNTDFDEEWGGFGRAPKFPMPGYFNILLEKSARRSKTKWLNLITSSLDKILDGGIWDHVGGGLHRYSVDQYWHVPHFEKMLYDQGQMSGVLAEAFRISGSARYAKAACQIIDYVSRDLRGELGQLFAAEDADSSLPEDPTRHGEGAFYVWTKQEIESLLGSDFELFAEAFYIKSEGNARPESDPHGELTGMNTLMRIRGDKGLAARFGKTESEVARVIEAGLKKLFDKRIKRPRPLLDDKTLLSWSSLMISGACKVYQRCGYEPALELATDAAEFLLASMREEATGSLARAFRNGRGNQNGFAEDYAAFACACLDLYESTSEVKWLQMGRELLEELEHRFLDHKRGGYFATESGDENLLVRLRDDYDGSEPAASSLAAMAQLKFASLLDDDEFRERGRRTVEAFGFQWKRAPRAMPQMLVAASRFLDSDQQIVLIGERGTDSWQSFTSTIHRHRDIGSAFVALDRREGIPSILSGNSKLAPMLESVSEGGAKVFICEDFACKEPVETVEAVEKILC